MTLNLLNLEWYGWVLLATGLTSLTHDLIDSFKSEDVARPSFFVSFASLTLVLYMALVPSS